MVTSLSSYSLKQLLVVVVSFLFVITINMSDVKGCFTSIFSFGDSYTDTGNVVHISLSESRELPRSAFPPHGRTFFRHPTGRSSDGPVAKDLGLPFVAPYFGGENGTSQNFQKGVNFAVSGATALDSAFLAERRVYGLVSNLSLGDEVGFFKDVLPSLCSSSSDCKEFLRTSLRVMGVIGGNDYTHAFQQGKKYDEVRGWVPLVVGNMASAINVRNSIPTCWKYSQTLKPKFFKNLKHRWRQLLTNITRQCDAGVDGSMGQGQFWSLKAYYVDIWDRI
ncbi:GDSL esterase/lipase [Theobroma cacao]|uniref:GDSL esterase/lipase n=1 Tax=Theobroma cacao TaxID=3641 RepID=A0A061F4V9_THECC|nr:GDSL esterase/lipase [Theobroma cacao]